MDAPASDNTSVPAQEGHLALGRSCHFFQQNRGTALARRCGGSAFGNSSKNRPPLHHARFPSFHSVRPPGYCFHSLAQQTHSTRWLYQARPDRFKLLTSGAHSIRPGGNGRACLVVLPPYGSHPAPLPHLLRTSVYYIPKWAASKCLWGAPERELQNLLATNRDLPSI